MQSDAVNLETNLLHAYKEDIARHYAAYRPPLHSLILDHCIPRGRRFSHGLDIGCGTGQSSRALTFYCNQIMAIDTSASMLRHAIVDEQIEYKHGDIRNLVLPSQYFDLITIAGCLYYVKSQAFIDRITFLSNTDSVLIIYDFNVDMTHIYEHLELQTSSEDYNHALDFDGLHCPQWQLSLQENVQTQFDIEQDELIHLIRSDHFAMQSLSNKAPKSTQDWLVDHTKKWFAHSKSIPVSAELFYSVYQMKDHVNE